MMASHIGPELTGPQIFSLPTIAPLSPAKPF